ncbi:MAG: alpha-2-macroglobulin family protein [Proteobacteria bacterium]|nr:alpha-2-macroglobulin family protein [Pseudomonadota bacterium]
MNRRLLIAGGAVFAVLLVVGVVLYYLGGGETGGPSGGLFERLKRGLTSVTQTMTPAQMAEAPEFAFRRLEIDTTKAQPEACLVFTRNLDQSGKTHYEDYLSIDPETRVVVRAIDQRLCIAGFAFNQTYNVTLKTGLPATTGEKLAEEETVPVELRDKPSLVRFSGGIVLPRDNADGVPVTTVNIDKLSLKVVRVGDRLLSQIENGVVDQTTMYSWDETQLESNQGSVVWSGSMDVQDVKNESVVTLIPIRDILKDKKPGAYVLIAMDAAKKKTDDTGEDTSDEMAAQWVIASDISVTTFVGANGMAAFARSYASAQPLGGVKLTLVARNNNILATATTNSEGRADFAEGLFRGTGGDEPVVVMAYGNDGDFSFIDLRRAAFDLTDRGVGGRDTPGPIDAFLYTERGVYRPGETIYSTAMLRDRVGAAMSAPLTLVATRPDGMEVARTTIAAASLAAGTTSWPVKLRNTAPHGRWQIAAYIDPKAPPVGRVQFDVADFVPQRLKVALTSEQKFATANSDLKVKAEARFLYGAPASALSGEGTARIAVDSDPYPAFSGFQFGRVDDTFAEVSIDLTVPETDALGVTEATAAIGDLAETTLPLKAAVKVSIHEPGGRTTDKSIDVPVHTRPVAIGLRADFDGGSVAENTKANFEAIAVDAEGKRIALSGLTFSWVREVTTYQWYQTNNEWKYTSVTRDRLVTSGQMNIAANASAKLGQSMPYGDYRLTITDPKTGASTSTRFYSGWAASSEGDRPDRIPVAANKPAYQPGERAHITIKPPSDGQALVVVAGDKIFSSQLIDAPAGGTSIDIPVSADWGAGAYVLVTDYRALNDATGREPVRAIGVTWIGVDNASRTLTPLIGGPAKITPRQKIVIPVTVKGLDSGEDAYLTLAAVDEGILQLTDFKSPDPVTYYFGKRKLGVGMHDDYGRLIKAEKGPVGSLREGGDNFAGRPLAIVPTRTVALFSGLVKVGAGGMAQIPIDVPDFNGELRLMAVVVSDKKIGHADRPLTVRDPVVADIVLPRFLAPGDRAEAALNMNNVEGPSGTYVATVTVGGPVGLDAGAPQDVITRPINRGQRILVPITLVARNLGIAGIHLRVTGPNGFKVAHDWPIQVRAPQLDVAREETVVFPANQNYVANRQLVSDVVPSTLNFGINVSSAHGYSDVPGLLRWLDKYPYGCIEQTTSRAMPLLYFNDLAPLAGLPKDQALHDRIQESVDNVLDMQNYAGNFGMWGPGSDADPFISVFALDFLNQAKMKGYVVPNEALRRGTGWLKSTASSDSFNDGQRAYAFYVLARMGQVNLSDLRYFSDTRGSEWNNAIAAALTGAAAAQAGDRSRANYAFGRAKQIVMDANPLTYTTDNYGSLVRDLAGTTALSMEGGASQLVPALMRRVGDVDMRLNATTTQEKAWMLRAAYELSRERNPLNIWVNGKQAQAVNGAVRLSPNYGTLSAGITLSNHADASVWRTVSVQGTPMTPLPMTASGLTLTKSVWTVDGQPADLAALKQNDRVIVLLQGQMTNNYYHQMAALDLLPAGLEIEMPLAGDDGKMYAWLGSLNSVTVQEARDDRYVAAFDIGSQYQSTPDPKKPLPPPPSFRLAYVARAVTAGTYVMPAGVVEDMYAPSILARTSMGTLTVGLRN